MTGLTAGDTVHLNDNATGGSELGSSTITSGSGLTLSGIGLIPDSLKSVFVTIQSSKK